MVSVGKGDAVLLGRQNIKKIYIEREGFEKAGQSQSCGHRCGVTTEVSPGDGRSGPGQLVLDHLCWEEVNTGPWRMPVM